MKRIVILLMVLMSTISVYAQFKKGDYLVCTGDNVNVRKGPGSNYGVIMVRPEAGNRLQKLQLYNGSGIIESPTIFVEIKYLGQKSNGFLKVYIHADSWEHCGDATGWVSAKYFRKRRASEATPY